MWAEIKIILPVELELLSIGNFNPILDESENQFFSINNEPFFTDVP